MTIKDKIEKVYSIIIDEGVGIFKALRKVGLKIEDFIKYEKEQNEYSDYIKTQDSLTMQEAFTENISFKFKNREYIFENGHMMTNGRIMDMGYFIENKNEIVEKIA